ELLWPDPEADLVLADARGRRPDLDDAARVAARERFEPGARVGAQADPLHSARAHEVGEVACGRAVVEEMPAYWGQRDLDGIPCAERIVPLVSVETAELAACVRGHERPPPAKAQQSREPTDDRRLGSRPNAVPEPRLEAAERESARPSQKPPRRRRDPTQVEDRQARGVDVNADALRYAVLDRTLSRGGR